MLVDGAALVSEIDAVPVFVLIENGNAFYEAMPRENVEVVAVLGKQGDQLVPTAGGAAIALNIGCLHGGEIP